MKTLHEIRPDRPYPNVPLWTDAHATASDPAPEGRLMDAWIENDRPFALWRGPDDQEFVICVSEWRDLRAYDRGDIATVHRGTDWPWHIWSFHYVTDTYDR